jgi:hypothetical protein
VEQGPGHPADRARGEPGGSGPGTPGGLGAGDASTLFWRQQEQIRLVQSDYEQTNEFIDGVVGTAALLRGGAITVWLGLIGFAFQQNLVALAVLAAVVAVVFWFVDGYHGWLYAEAAHHLRDTERVTAAYYRALGEDSGQHARRASTAEPETPTPPADLRTVLGRHKFGLFKARRQDVSWIFPLLAKPIVVYRVLYPLLVGVAIASAVAIGPFGAGKQHDEPQEASRLRIEKIEKTTVTALNGSVEIRLKKVAGELSSSRNPAEHRLGLKIAGVLAAGVGALAAIKLLAGAPEAIAAKALPTLLGIAGDLLKGGLSLSASPNFNSLNISPTTGPNFTTGPDFSTGLSLSGAPSFTFNSFQSATGKGTAADCVAYLVELDDLVDDDPGIARLLPKQVFPLDAGAKACKLSGPLTESSGLLRALATH